MCKGCKVKDHEPEACDDAKLETPGCACQHRKGSKLMRDPHGGTILAPPGVTTVDVMR